MEICSGVTAVKYLYKYIYKGHDKVAIHISPNDDENLVDEIKQFQDARGSRSFEDLLTVNGVGYSSFKQVAQKRGLLESDQSIIECLNEVITFQMPHELRRLFAIILVYCAPKDVRLLWDTYFDAMSEDLKRETTISVEFQVSKTLQSLNLFLESMGKSISLYDLPTRPTNMDNVDCEFPREIQDEMLIQIPLEDYEPELKLNLEQHKAFSIIIDTIQKEKSGIFFIDGLGGTGKTFLYRALLAHLRSKKLITIATAFSRVARNNARRKNSAFRFKIPIDANESSECTMSKQSGAAELLRRSKLFLWDEAPMAKRWAIENVDKLLKDVKGNDQDFGGKVVVLGEISDKYYQLFPRQQFIKPFLQVW
ncbi:hypothetical protein Sango_3011500 [Sesamum angolense]|uniref:ATP-dependent DNA helicase n=1 Tax=Sesamum angolense TaxID=2727404 RepID=A0AAE1T4C8_9LAMI|nr:hypothetical protein Sango_3011500 [Sesamum angolense]